MSRDTRIYGADDGPLATPVCDWAGDMGMDVAPGPDVDDMRCRQRPMGGICGHPDVNNLRRLA